MINRYVTLTVQPLRARQKSGKACAIAKTERTNRLTLRFIGVLQRWQNYHNIAPFKLGYPPPVQA